MDIPDDIWLQVSQYIDKEHLCSLLSVNSVFFEIAMDARYRYLYVNSMELPSERLLYRLLDKEVAKRVRVLRFLFNHVKEETPPKSPRTLKDIGRRLGHTLRHRNTSERLPCPLTFSIVLELLINAFPQMTNVGELYFDSWDLRPKYDIHPFFLAAWLSFGRNLHKVHLSGHLGGYSRLLNSSPSFDSVRELRLEFTDPMRPSSITADTSLLDSGIIRFVNCLAPQLHTLKVWSWASVDLSPFFTALDGLPLLETLGVRMPFNKSLSDPSPLYHLLLNTSSTIQNLELRLNPLGANLNPSIEDDVGQWFSTCLKDDRIFSDLHKLDMYPTNVVSSVDILVKALSRSSLHLEELIIRDRYLHEEEVMTVVNALGSCNKLVFLRMNIWRLHAKVFDFLSSKLPQLLRLELFVGDVVTEHSGSMDSFVADMKERKYDSWKLYDVGLWQGGYAMNSEGYVSSLRRSIPTVKSFCGNACT